MLLNPIAPHITEELWSLAGFEKTIANQAWPQYDESKTIDSQIEIPVQVNGKVRATVTISTDSDEETVKEIVHRIDNIKASLQDKVIVKEIYIQNKIYNIVVK